MRLFRRHRPEPAAEAAPPAPPAPEPDTPARAVQVVTGPPPLRTPEPAPPPPAAAPAPQEEARAEPTSPPEPAPEPAAAAARTPEWPRSVGRWHLATADVRVPAASTTSRRAALRESHHSRWHQV